MANQTRFVEFFNKKFTKIKTALKQVTLCTLFKLLKFFFKFFFKPKKNINSNNENLLIIEQTTVWTNAFLEELHNSKKQLICCTNVEANPEHLLESKSTEEIKPLEEKVIEEKIQELNQEFFPEEDKKEKVKKITAQKKEKTKTKEV